MRVHAVSINDWDLAFLDDHFANRLGRLFTRTKILGCDIAGRVESGGPGATRFKPGDAVYGDLPAILVGLAGLPSTRGRLKHRWR
jgi:NADPH:quinone reductase-like Zn-dependent oxidoreductase